MKRIGARAPLLPAWAAGLGLRRGAELRGLRRRRREMSAGKRAWLRSVYNPVSVKAS